MFGTRLARIAAVVAISTAAVIGAAVPSAAAPDNTSSHHLVVAVAPQGTLSHYQVIAAANVHTNPSHTSRVIEVKQPGDIVTSPLPPCQGEPDPDGVTFWIEVNLASGGVGWMGLGQLRWVGGTCVQ